MPTIYELCLSWQSPVFKGLKSVEALEIYMVFYDVDIYGITYQSNQYLSIDDLIISSFISLLSVSWSETHSYRSIWVNSYTNDELTVMN